MGNSLVIFKIKKVFFGSLLIILLTACSAPAARPTPNLTATASTTPLPSPMSTITPTLTPTAIRTPPVLPKTFQTSLLNAVDPPHTYISNTCQYLQDKWSSKNSSPGTVVLAIMFHGIEQPKPGVALGSNQIPAVQFNGLMNSLQNHNFEAISTAQLAAFLEHNTKIPPLSVILIVDDRPSAQYFNDYFRPWWEADHWPVVSAWISTPLNTAEQWQEQVNLENEGWVDHQAHGVVHNIPMWPGVSDAYIIGELQGSINAFKLHFNKVPIAIIWPGGGFSTRSVQLARQLGYQLGFTTSAGC